MLALQWLSGIVALFGFFPYIKAIIKKETSPHLLTWIIWTLIGLLLAASYFAAGASLGDLIIPFAYVIGEILVMTLALKYGKRGYDPGDILCFFGALLSIILWILTKNALLALFLNILVDFLGAVPTIRQVYSDPKSENLTGWIFFLVGNGLNLLALGKYTLVVLSYPLYLFLISLLVTALILKGK